MRIRVPATSANVGPGFDTMGIALALYNSFDLEVSDTLRISGCDDEFANADNLFYKAYKFACAEMGVLAPEIDLKIHAEIPVTRGLGSSAAMIVGGVCAAAAIARVSCFSLAAPGDAGLLTDGHSGVFSFDNEELKKILEIAASLEGHPDNASPAVFGGYQVSIADYPEDGGLPKIERAGFSVDEDLIFNALVPSFMLETKKARAVLPHEISRRDAVFTSGHAVLTALAFASHSYESLASACKDVLHQPYRKALIPGWDEIVEACASSGALAVWLSGAGPTIVALTRKDSLDSLPGIDSALEIIGKKTGHSWKRMQLSADNMGVTVEFA